MASLLTWADGKEKASSPNTLVSDLPTSREGGGGQEGGEVRTEREGREERKERGGREGSGNLQLEYQS